MNFEQIVTIIASLCSILVFTGTLVAKLIQGHTSKLVAIIVKEYLSELKPNHGSSLKDAVNEIKTELINVKVNMASLEGKFDQHIKENI